MPVEGHIGIMKMQQIFTAKEAATLLRVSPLTLWKWHKKGLAHPVQVGVGGKLRWPRHEVDRLLGKTNSGCHKAADSGERTT